MIGTYTMIVSLITYGGWVILATITTISLIPTHPFIIWTFTYAESHKFSSDISWIAFVITHYWSYRIELILQFILHSDTFSFIQWIQKLRYMYIYYIIVKVDVDETCYILSEN